MSKRIGICKNCGTRFESKLLGPVAESCQNCRAEFYHHRYSSRYVDGHYVKQPRVPKVDAEKGKNYILPALIKAGYHCEICDSADMLHVHHKDGFGSTKPCEERNNKLSNLQVLCEVCHGLRHHKGAKERRDIVKRMRKSNCTFQYIADYLHISRQRAHQISKIVS